MLKKITVSEAASPLGHAFGQKLLEIVSGEYSGRLVVLMQTSASEIKLSCADPPHTSWSNLQTIVSDAYDGSFDCVMEPDGDIHLAYSETSTNYLVTRKLTFSGGSWSVGSKVTAFNGDQCFDPSVALEQSGTLWLSFARFSSPTRTIQIKSSTDGGTTWGAGASDPGTELVGSSTSAYGKTVVGPDDIYLIYTRGGQFIAMRSRPVGGGNWSTAQTIASGNDFSGEFDAAINSDGLLGVVFYNLGIYYREYDGNSWGTTVTIDDNSGHSPQIFFRQNVPVVAYLAPYQGAQMIMKYTVRKTGSFPIPAVLDSRAKPYDSVILYNASSETCEDLTTAAESGATADVYHSESGCLIKDAGDRLYLGMEAPFRYAHFHLSTAGSGGTVNYNYWDGAEWKELTPASGVSHLDATNVPVLLWNDYLSVPDDWQKCPVNSVSRFWLRIEVVSSYSTGPVGSRISAVSGISRLIFRR